MAAVHKQLPFPRALAETLHAIPAVGEVLNELRSRLFAHLGENLVGLYLYGSLVLGHFDPEQSDLDLLAALSSEIGERELPVLRRLHDDFVNRHPDWDNRVEIAYVSTSALRTFKSHASKVAIISPGEPLHIKEVAREWLIDYFVVQEHGITLFGPPPRTLIEDISRDEFLNAVRDYVARLHGSLTPSATRGPQRYAVLTMCRSLYALRHGRQTSKKCAATWAQKKFPEWAPVIECALASANDEPASEADHRETARFVEFGLCNMPESPPAAG